MKLTMVGRLSECLLLSYRAKAQAVAPLVPAGLELVTLDDRAFWNIVISRIEKMRPAGVWSLLGISYYHVAYRLLVRAGDSREGLYFVRSDADSLLISEAGNLASDFRFHPARVSQSEDSSGLTFEVSESMDGAGDARLRIDLESEPRLSRDSCFASLDEARRFLKYRPLGLSVDGRSLKIAEVFRDEAEWRETPVSIAEAHWEFFDRLAQDEMVLELATRVSPIDYRWRLGRRELL